MILHSKERLLRSIINGEPDMVELLVAFIALGWGVWLLIPGWRVFDTGPAYAGLRELGIAESVYGCLCVGIGSFQLFAWLQDKRSERKRGALLSACLWFFVTLSFIWSNFHQTTIPTYGPIFTASLWAYWRL
jgi:hypothetical protein